MDTLNTIPNQIILDQVPGYLAWKNINCEYMGANQNFLKALGFKKDKQLQGRKDRDLELSTEEEIQLFYQQDLLALKGQSQEIIHELQTDKETNTYLLRKAPLYIDGDIQGVIYHCSHWTKQDLIKSLKILEANLLLSTQKPKYYHLDPVYNPIGLSQRELECMFLLLRGQTAKKIAAILKLSKRTIESYIENIKNKFGCINKTELLIAAISKGYNEYIPKRIINLNFSELGD